MNCDGDDPPSVSGGRDGNRAELKCQSARVSDLLKKYWETFAPRRDRPVSTRELTPSSCRRVRRSQGGLCLGSEAGVGGRDRGGGGVRRLWPSGPGQVLFPRGVGRVEGRKVLCRDDDTVPGPRVAPPGEGTRSFPEVPL